MQMAAQQMGVSVGSVGQATGQSNTLQQMIAGGD